MRRTIVIQGKSLADNGFNGGGGGSGRRKGHFRAQKFTLWTGNRLSLDDLEISGLICS